MATILPAPVAATAVSTLVNSLGVNTHIDFGWSSYGDLTAVQTALAYLGVTNVRDSIDNPADLAKFAALNRNLGVTFDFFIAPGDVGMAWQLQQIESDPAIVRFVEGPNESDNWPVSYDGLTGLAATAAEQQALFASVKAALPNAMVAGPSFGQVDNYSLVGNLGAAADYANAHIYFGTGNSPADQGWIQTMLANAALVVPGKPVMTTETGYYTSSNPSDPHGVDPTVQAKYVLDDVMDQFSAGVSMDYLYELVDQQPDPGNTNPELHFGLFNSDWTPKPAAVAVHNLLQLLRASDAGGAATGTLSYGLTGMPDTGHSLLLEKSDGTFVLVLWNDARLSGPVTGQTVNVAPTPVTLTLANPAALIDVYDPLTGTSKIQTASNVSQIALSLPDHPILIEIGAAAGAQILQSQVPPAPVLSPQAPTGVAVNVPAGLAVAAGQTSGVIGVTIADPWAAGTLGGMTLNLSALSGTLTLTDAGGNPLAGSGTGAITLNGSIFQINTDLAHLWYTAAGSVGADTITVDIWDPAGLEATTTIAVTVGAAPPVAVPGPVITAPASEAVVAGATSQVLGVSVADAFAANNPGSLVLNLTAGNGTLAMTDAGGALIGGSGTASLSVSGTLAELNADLTHLLYTAPSGGGGDSIGFDVWDQAGQEAVGAIAVTLTAPPVTPPLAPPATGPAVAMPANAVPVGIVTTPGHDLVVPPDETVTPATPWGQILSTGTVTNTSAASSSGHIQMAFQAGKTIATNNTSLDTSLGGGSRAATPAFGGIFASVEGSGDLPDLRSLLATTTWKSDIPAVGGIIQNNAAVPGPQLFDAVHGATPPRALGWSEAP